VRPRGSPERGRFSALAAGASWCNVVHFASCLIVPKSVEQLFACYCNNTGLSRNLIEAWA